MEDLNKVLKIDAVISLFGVDSFTMCNANGVVKWKDGHETTDEENSQIDEEFARLQAEYDAQEYARKRQAEYPSVQELVVALYDTDDKAVVDEKRAAVKLKYPKP
jgi:hypothetical protein